MYGGTFTILIRHTNTGKSERWFSFLLIRFAWVMSTKHGIN